MVDTAELRPRPQRANSSEKGAAVLRALSRTPSYHEGLQMMSDVHTQRTTEQRAPRPAAAPNSAAWEYWVVKWEIPRKLLHFSTGFIVFAMYLNHVNPASVLRVFIPALAVICTAEVLRFSIPAFERLYERVLGVFMREGENVCTRDLRRNASTGSSGTCWA